MPKDFQDTVESNGHLRITLTSRNTISLEKICRNIINNSKEKQLKVNGPIRIPNKYLVVTTRKSPCGEGTNTWDRFEIVVHKRIIDIYSSENTLKQITTINVEPGVEVEVVYSSIKSNTRVF